MTDKELISWKPEAIGGRRSEKGGSASERADTKVNFITSWDFFELFFGISYCIISWISNCIFLGFVNVLFLIFCVLYLRFSIVPYLGFVIV